MLLIVTMVMKLCVSMATDQGRKKDLAWLVDTNGFLIELFCLIQGRFLPRVGWRINNLVVCLYIFALIIGFFSCKNYLKGIFSDTNNMMWIRRYTDINNNNKLFFKILVDFSLTLTRYAWLFWVLLFFKTIWINYSWWQKMQKSNLKKKNNEQHSQFKCIWNGLAFFSCGRLSPFWNIQKSYLPYSIGMFCKSFCKSKIGFWMGKQLIKYAEIFLIGH